MCTVRAKRGFKRCDDCLKDNARRSKKSHALARQAGRE
jgi:hypothetical protein